MGVLLANPMSAGAQPKVIRIGASGNIYIQWKVENAPPPTGEQIVPRGSYLFKQPLVPSGVARITADIRDSAGKLAVPAGSVLFKVERLWTIYCFMDSASIKVNGDRAACLSDAKDSGSFYQLFYHPVGDGFLPSLRDKIPGRLEPIEPVPFTVLKDGEWPSPYYLGVKFVGWKGFPGTGPLFDFVGGPGADMQVVGALKVRKSDVPMTVEQEGARVTVTAWNDEELRATVDRVYDQNRSVAMLATPTMIYVPAIRY